MRSIGSSLLVASTIILSVAPGFVAVGARSAELEGVQMADTLAVGDTTLKLNGIGVRTRFILDVYVGALYLPHAATSTRAILESDAPRAIIIEFLRDVGRDKIRDAYREGFMANAPDQTRREHANIARLLDLIPDVHKGERIVFAYQPGIGATITMPGSMQASFEGREFADAYFLLYLGPHPADENLKAAMLGLK